MDTTEHKSTLRWIPVIGTVAFLLGAFAVGVINYLTVDVDELADPATPAESWLQAGTDALFGAVLIGFPVVIAFLLRFIGYDRFQKRYGRPSWFVILAVVAEAAFALMAWWMIWTAVTPIVDAGFVWLLYLPLTVVWAVLSLIPLLAAFVKPRKAKVPVAA
ncbi:hypothetical protein [Demequina sp.]|uniref:hypothetical protein n=1 Tax=Demequina sp. TaxID=2050685 RepID=UPI003D11697E